ncbi:MAG: ATPase, T2SS/T4P/T4SS family [Vampirovibrionales bacterium]|nr:ATPase, T2SS/T4P/T4SS family [Vampirovibrionales bacterium]
MPVPPPPFSNNNPRPQGSNPGDGGSGVVPQTSQGYSHPQAKEALQNGQTQFISGPSNGGSVPPQQQVVQANQQASTSKAPLRLGDILTANGLINEDQLKRALSQSKSSKLPLGMTLVRLGYVDESDIGRALAQLHHLQYISLKGIQVDPELLSLLPEDFMKRHLVLPLRLNKELRRLEVAVARPDHVAPLDEIALITGYRAVPRVSTHSELLAFFDTHFKQHFSGDEALRKLEANFKGGEDVYLTQENDSTTEADIEDAPVVQLVNALLLEAIELNASDIHVEPQRAQLLIRYRVDGILREVKNIPRKMAGAVISRIKVSSGMDIAERRRPQDGRMRIKVGSQEVDMRVSTIPIQFGEKIVIRVLRSTVMSGGLANVGLNEDEFRIMSRLIKSPNGIILVTGPTGSGKTTTLYGCLREINSPEVNICTVEDPVEYPLLGVNQVAINPKAGITFASTLRAFLRQDPDVILVGEVRDHETLESAIHAALTGHLVFSTLHTNSAAKSISRLSEMGAQGYLISSTVIGIVAQRLIRKLCPHCKVPYTPTMDDLEQLHLSAEESHHHTLYNAAGCSQCENTGYSGRMPIYEILRVTREIQELIDTKASSFTIQDMAIQQGMNTLAMSARSKILQGHTTLPEAIRVLGLDW